MIPFDDAKNDHLRSNISKGMQSSFGISLPIVHSSSFCAGLALGISMGAEDRLTLVISLFDESLNKLLY